MGWLLRLSTADAMWHWTEISPHQDGRRTERGPGHVVLSKWPGRICFAAAVATGINPKAIYVTGGRGAVNNPTDFWASSDRGSTWYCMCQRVPWGGRINPGLAVVPGHYERVVLVGGVGDHGMVLADDVWISDDAGSSWHSVRVPEWEPRSTPLLYFAPPTATKQRVLLVLGGYRLLEESSGDRAHFTRSRYLDDAWEVKLDFSTHDAEWRQLGTYTDAEDEQNDARGFDGHIATFEPSAARRPGLSEPRSEWTRPGGLVLLRSGETFVASPEAPHSWAMAPVLCSSETTSNAVQLQDWRTPERTLQMALAAGPRAACPRLFIFSRNGVAATGVGELAWQRHFLQRLGFALESGPVALPSTIWLWRVVPYILPQRPVAKS